MKVLHVIAGVARRYGGPSQAIMDICHALDGVGVETVIATTNADGRDRLQVPLGAPIDYQGVRAVFFPHQWSEAFKLSLPLSKWLSEHVRAFDVVHIHGVFSHPSLAAASASRRARVPYVVRPLGNLDPWGMRQNARRKHLFLKLAGQNMLQQAAAIHYTTRAEMQLAEGSFRLARGVVVPLGLGQSTFDAPVDAQRFRLARPELGDAPYVIMLGRLHPVKGVDTFLEAFLDVTQQADLTGWRLVLAGDGEPSYVAELKRQVQQRDHRNQVHFVGWLDTTDKLAALDAASLLAVPSQQENFGVSVAEAMARGVPVLISPHVNLAPDIEAAQAGWVVPLRADSLRVGLTHALRQYAERTRRGSAGRLLARERFTWDRLAHDLVALYHTVTR